MSSLARKLLTAFGVLGLGASSAAAYVHYQLIRNPDYSSFCDINATVTCKTAYLSRYGSIGGVPVAVGGVVFFVWVLLMVWASRGKSRVADTAPGYIFGVSTLALAAVLYLAYASFFILHAACPLCITTDLAVIGVFIVSGGASSVPMSSLPRRAVRDVGIMLTTPVALIVALLFVVGAASGVTLFPQQTERPVVPTAPPLNDQQQTEFERWWNMQPRVTLPFPSDGAKVDIVEFSDMQCPACRAQYFAYEPIFQKYADRPQDVKLTMKMFPLNANCNANITATMHPAACDAAAAVVMARGKGTFDKVVDYFFVHQDDMTPDWVKHEAADVGKVKDFDAEFPRAIQEVKTEASAGGPLQIDSTPTFFINGRRLPGGGIPPQYFDEAIQLELKNPK
ncbi:MAG: vitamin K epoxide reductase family protein [Vicinamibacterales bacterium]